MKDTLKSFRFHETWNTGGSSYIVDFYKKHNLPDPESFMAFLALALVRHFTAVVSFRYPVLAMASFFALTRLRSSNISVEDNE